MTARTQPWFAATAAGWESARERLPRPLTRDEAITDLRWWHRQVRLQRDDPATGRPLRRMPGRDRLADEWGWRQRDRVHTPAKVRELLQQVHLWHPPAKRQESASDSPDDDTANADNGQESASKVPVPTQHQQSASADEVKRQESGGKRQQSARTVPDTSQESAANVTNGAGYRSIDREVFTTTDPPKSPADHPADQVSHNAVTPAQRRLLQILRRWTAPGANAPHRWTVRWDEVLGWWAQSILTRPEYAGLDLDHQLERWDGYLERAADLHGKAGSRGPRFPKIWKNAIYTWLTNAVRYTARSTGPTDHDQRQPRRRRRPDQPPRRDHDTRRGQQGSPSLFDFAPSDAGAGADHD
jgi:hypothetical protein